MTILRSAIELLKIVTLRFKMPSRVFAILLMTINLLSVFFLDSIYGRVALIVMILSLFIMVPIHMKFGFVRLLGLGHILWIPMVPWMAMNLSTLPSNSLPYYWMSALIGFNTISLLIDIKDVTLFLRGDRQPYYSV